MSHQPINLGTTKLTLLIKSAYWVALLIIAAMAMASFVFLQQMLAAQQSDQSLLALTSTQKALSQRVVFLATAASSAEPKEQPDLIERLKAATGEFESNYDLLLDQIGADPMADDRADPGSINAVLFAKPHHLDYFSTTLAANGWRLIAALESKLGIGESPVGYLAGDERARLDEKVASATLGGYAALDDRIETAARLRLDSLLSLHRILFFATIAVIILVALFIFRPLSNVILRRTHELVDARNSMAFIAVHDGLTGLHNRTFLTNHFDELIKGARRRQERLAVVQIDLDRFKQINDTLGHAAGDYVLVVTAERMRESCRSSDFCARLGGDEFIVILNGTGSSIDIDMLSKRIVQRINEPIVFQGVTIHPGASAGIAVFPVDADNAADLVVHADLALYAAKKQGGGAISYFSDELRQELEHRKKTEADLRVAIADESFTVYFQPQVSLATSAITGVEALVRWNHPERGMVAPGEFIPIAEKCGLMASIGRIIVRKAIAEAARMAPCRHSVRAARRECIRHGTARARFRPLSLRNAGANRACHRRSCRSRSSNRSFSTMRRRASRRSCAISAPLASISNWTISARAMPRSAMSIRTRSTV
jgi:diguanylate cyclase (GGDEF)-like protein